MTTTFKKVRWDIANSDGNAFAVMGGWSRNARQQGWSKAEIDAVLKDAQSGDYDHLLQVIIKHTD